MLSRRLILACTLAASVPGAAIAQEPSSTAAPLGLRWGASRQELADLGVNLSAMEAGPWGQAAAARNLPVSLQDAASVQLFFGFADKLWRIAVVSREWQNDHHGNLARNRFSQLESLLSERYVRIPMAPVTYSDESPVAIPINHRSPFRSLTGQS